MYQIEFDYVKKEFVKPMKENLSLKDKKDFDIIMELYNEAVDLWKKEKSKWDGKSKVMYFPRDKSIFFIELETINVIEEKVFYKNCFINCWKNTETNKKHFSINYQSTTLFEKFDEFDEAKKFIDKNLGAITSTKYTQKNYDENGTSLI